MRRRIIEAMTYPRMLMMSRMDLQECPMHRYYSADQQVCQTCDQGAECHWLNSNEEFSVLIEQPIEALFEALVYSIDYVDAHISRDGHNFRHCTCETCTWAKDARYLVRRYRGHAVKVAGRPSIQKDRHSNPEK